MKKLVSANSEWRGSHPIYSAKNVELSRSVAAVWPKGVLNGVMISSASD